jgi:ATP-dependent Clp protease ATP-binding subunit ClpC
VPHISVGVRLTWVLAAVEADIGGHELIEPEHLFIGICKLEDIATPSCLRKLQLGQTEIADATSEIEGLMRLLKQFNLDPVMLRRTLRSRIGKGLSRKESNSERTKHRSPRSRAIFDFANRLASHRNKAEYTVSHLLAALLDEQGSSVVGLLKENNVVVAALKDEAMGSLSPPDSPQPRSVIAGKPADSSVLRAYGKDLIQEARSGRIHETIGRKKEMLQVVRTLSRVTKNNPVLVGEPGVGKTAVAEGLAWRMAVGNVPAALREKRIIQIQVADLVAGTKYRGEFEERVQSLVREVATTSDVILFLDEIHAVVGTGKANGGLDVANILKPALARGELRCIGATTLAEYRKHIEKDPALERRFQPISITEPTPEETIEILRKGMCPRFEEKHMVKITEEALMAAVNLSTRYLMDRHLPDKAIDLLDKGCARVRITQLSIFPHASGLEKGINIKSDRVVTAETIADVVSEWTGIPVNRLAEEDRVRLLTMADILKARIIGQDEAVEAVADVVCRARAGLKTASRPIGVLLFLGPTGVGKTELAKATAEFLFGSEKAMIRLDMSEFREKHMAARLVGSPPGYIGSEEEGQLTGALRRKPFSVVLLDEVDKAHPDVLNIFLQVFDDGRLTDAKGRTADASNALFLLTSNFVLTRGIGFQVNYARSGREDFVERKKAAFRPEFMNRLDRVVVFQPLTHEHVARIAQDMLTRLKTRVEEHGISLQVTDEGMALLVLLGYDQEYGARPMRRMIEEKIENPLSTMFLRGEVREGMIVVVDAKADNVWLKVEERI